MIATLEWTLSNVQQNTEQLQTPTMGVTINKKVNNNRTTALERTGLVLTLGHTFWFCASLSAMHVGEVPHYRPCLFPWYFTIDHACWSIATATDILLVECRWKKNGYTSSIALTEVPLHQTCLLIWCNSRICLLLQCKSIRHACWVHLFRYACL